MDPGWSLDGARIEPMQAEPGRNPDGAQKEPSPAPARAGPGPGRARKVGVASLCVYLFLRMFIGLRIRISKGGLLSQTPTRFMDHFENFGDD